MTGESERAVQAAIEGEMRLLDPEVRASPARVLELLDPAFIEFGASGRRWDVESILTVTSGDSVSLESPDPLLGGRFCAELLEGLAAVSEVLRWFPQPFTKLPVGGRLDVGVGVLADGGPGGAVGGDGLVVALRRIRALRPHGGHGRLRCRGCGRRGGGGGL
ncbi:hypothetical protein [Streptomyces anulatus]|uniref:hypothetical protein n=1 Tax=Streptomyces anulatus TaxID=1892 RepID=UPI00365E6F6E